MTEVNASVTVVENAQPEREKYYSQSPRIGHSDGVYELEPLIEKEEFHQLWLEVINPFEPRHTVSLEIYFGAGYFEYVCVTSEWMVSWLSGNLHLKGVFSKLDGVLCRVSLSGDRTLLRVVFVFEEPIQQAPEVFAYHVAAYWRECIMRRFRFCKEIERLPLEPGLGPVACHRTISQGVQRERLGWLLSGHRLYGDNTAQEEYFCGRYTKR